MNVFKRAWGTLFPKFLGGDLITTVGSAKGEVAVGTTADLFKATGEIRVHLVRTRESTSIVTVELVQTHVPGDGPNLTCVHLPISEATRLGEILCQAADDAVQQRDTPDGATRRR